VHLSALNANPDSKNDYLRAKGRGEKAVLEEFPEAIIVRPGKMFGHEDKLFNYLGSKMYSHDGRSQVDQSSRQLSPVNGQGGYY